ncbi:hypothetical protein CBW53_02965 [Yersinia frederiksenii]|nr:hypothetical protein CBW53_02965 [Yersinia frederiksenii]
MKKNKIVDKKEMIKAMCKKIAGGRSSLADAMNMTIDQFNNNLYEKNGCRFFSIEELLKIQELSKSTIVAEFFAIHRDAVVVQNPTIENLDNVELHDLRLHNDVYRGDVDQTIFRAINNDGYINKEEKNEILQKHFAHIKARHLLVKSTILVHQLR